MLRYHCRHLGTEEEKKKKKKDRLGNTAPARLGKRLPNALMNLTCSPKYVRHFITREAYYLGIAT